MSFKLSRLVFLGLLLSVSLRLVLSNWLLNDFYPYTLPGGFWYQKIHPGSFLALALLVLVLLFRNPFRFVKEQCQHQPAALQFSVVTIVISLLAVLRFGFGGTAYLIDTFAIGTLYVLLAGYLSQKEKRWLANSIFFLVIANSIIAVLEFAMKHHLIESDVPFSFFRATALFGHPLANALITATTAIVVLKMEWAPATKVSVGSILLLALFAFGGRGAMVTLLLGILIFLLVRGFAWEGRLRKRLGAILAFYIGLFVVAATVYFVVFETKIGTPIASRIMMDSSIQARFGSLTILRQLTVSEIIWGMDQAEYARLADKYAHLTPIIENFWVVLLLRLSLPLFAVFSGSFLYMLLKTAKREGWLVMLIMFVFLLAASTNNSLSGKSPALAVYLLLVSCVSNMGNSSLGKVQAR